MKQTLILALLISVALPLSAQFGYQHEMQNNSSPWSVEFRSGASFSTNNLGDADLGTGFGFEGAFAYRFMPHLAAYAGWGWNKFSAEQSFAGPDMDFEETGYTFGFQFIHPFDNSSIGYLIRMGGLYNHIETENSNGDIIANSGHGLGWQVETGITIPVGATVKILPSVRYRSLSRTTTIGSVKTDTDLRYFSIGAGLLWSL